MNSTIQQASRFEDLLTNEQSEEAYAFSTIFDQKNWRTRQRSKQKFKLLQRLDSKIRSALQEGERVRYVTFGSGVSFLESYLIGWVMYILNRRAILVTDRRILMLQIDLRMRPRELASQLRYSTIRKVGRTVLGNTKVRLGTGKTCVFAHVPKADRKVLQKIVQFTDQNFEQEEGGFEDLCPYCFTVLKGRPTRCETCGGTFKSAQRAALLSLAFPGLGDFYLGHRKFAVLEMLFAAFIWLGVLMPNPENPMPPAALLIMAGFVVLFVHGPDALATRHIARKGFYPDEAPISGG